MAAEDVSSDADRAVAAHLDRSVEATEQVLSRARAAFRTKYQASADE